MEGHRRRELRAFSADVASAYYGAHFQRAKRMPDLGTILKKITGTYKRPEPMTPLQLLAMVRKWQRSLGGEDTLAGIEFRNPEEE